MPNRGRVSICLEYLITILVWLYVSLPLLKISRGWLYGFDVVAYTGPASKVISESWKSGTVPLWDPYSFGGIPFLGRLGSGSLYLPNLIFAGVNIHTALQLSIALHLLILALGFLTFVTFGLHLRKPAGAVAGIAALTSGFVAANTLSFDRLVAFSLFPWILFFGEKIIQSEKPWKYVFFLVTSSSLFIFGGHPQFIYVLGVFAIIYISSRVIIESAWRNIRVLLVSGFLVLGTSSLQLVSTYFLNKSSPMSGPKSLASLSETAYVLRPQHLLLGLTGDVFSDNPIGVTGSSEAIAGVGLVVFLLSLVSFANWLATRRNHLIPLLFFMIIASLALSVGARWFPFRMLHQYLPGFSSARVPGRLLMVALISSLILAAFGVHLIMERSVTRNQMLIWVAVLLIGFLSLKTTAFTDPSISALRWGLLLIVVISMCWLINRNQWGARLVVVLIVLVICIEGVTGSTKTMNLRPRLDVPMTEMSSPITDFLSLQGGRSIALTQDKFGDYPYLVKNLRPNSHTLNNVHSVDGYDGGPWVQNRWVAGMQELTNQEFNLYLTARSQMPRPLDARKAANLGIRWAVIDTEIGNRVDQLRNWTGPVKRWASIEVWLNPFWSGPKVLPTIESHSLSIATLERRINIPLLSGDEFESGKVTSYSLHVNGFKMHVSNAERSILIVDQTWHPDWKIRVNGKNTDPFPVNELLMGLELDPGDHDVIAVFEPTWYRPLLLVSMLSILVSLFCSVVSVIRMRTQNVSSRSRTEQCSHSM
jgi:hypothetical protein